MSVYNQLDRVAYQDIEPFGRVRPRDAHWAKVYVVGASKDSGALVRSDAWSWDMIREPSPQEIAGASPHLDADWRDLDLADLTVIANDEDDVRRWAAASQQAKRMIADRVGQREWMALSRSDWEELPLIVLAGLR
jgi:hypothetical protein